MEEEERCRAPPATTVDPAGAAPVPARSTSKEVEAAAGRMAQQGCVSTAAARSFSEIKAQLTAMEEARRRTPRPRSSSRRPPRRSSSRRIGLGAGRRARAKVRELEVRLEKAKEEGEEAMRQYLKAAGRLLRSRRRYKAQIVRPRPTPSRPWRRAKAEAELPMPRTTAEAKKTRPQAARHPDPLPQRSRSRRDWLRGREQGTGHRLQRNLPAVR